MRLILFILTAFIAVTAIFSGLLMINDPEGRLLNIPLKILSATPFKNFFIPGLILTLIVGGTNLVAVIGFLQHTNYQLNWSIAGGIVLCGWILIQLILLGFTHWLQVLYLAVGILTILAGWQLKGKWAA